MLQYLEMYQPTFMESLITDAYRKHRIQSPQDIDLEWWCIDRSIWIHYSDVPTTHYETDEDMYSIIVDRRLPESQQKVELAHELGHVLMHAGNQKNLPQMMVDKQEWEADRFAFYALCPTFMIANVLTTANSRGQLVEQLAYHFDVPDPFMDFRLEMLERRIQTMIAEKQMRDAMEAISASYDYTFRHPANERIEYWVKDNRVIHRRLRAEI